jgi:hypothetical protein
LTQIKAAHKHPAQSAALPMPLGHFENSRADAIGFSTATAFEELSGLPYHNDRQQVGGWQHGIRPLFLPAMWIRNRCRPQIPARANQTQIVMSVVGA